MTDRRPTPPPVPDVPPDNGESPSGAVAITFFLAATILVLWFGMFFLTLVRG